MRAALLFTVILAGCASTTKSDSPATSVPDEYRLVYAQDFGSQECLGEFDFSDAASWTWNAEKSALELVGVGSYAPPHRSPSSLAILKQLELEDFVLEAELMQTGRDYGHRDLCLFFGYAGPSRYYYVHLAPAPDENAHNVFLVDEAPRRNLAGVFEKGLAWKNGEWHRVRLEREGADVRVYVDGARTPTVEARDATIKTGKLGFGSFDDSGMIRSLEIWAPAP